MGSNLRVAMIIQSYYPHVGGAERQLARLAPLLQARGVEPFVLTRRYPGLSSYECIQGVPVYRLPVPGPKPVAALSFTLSALPLLRRLDPHVIHAHELLSPASTALAARRLFGKPVAAKVLRGGVLGDLAKLRNRPLGESRIRALRDQIDMFISISREIDAELDEIQVPPERRVFIPNGVDTRHFTPLTSEDKQALRQRLGLPSGVLSIFTGRFAPEKRLKSLVELWPEIRRQQPEAGLVLLGDGEQREMLEQQAGEEVQVLAPVDDVAPYLQACDIFILPSATEGLSNALLEGMAAGLAVVATQVGGAPDLIENGLSGCLVQPDQPEALKQAILSLITGPALRQSMAARGREKVVASYSLPAAADSLVGLYQRLSTQREGK